MTVVEMGRLLAAGRAHATFGLAKMHLPFYRQGLFFPFRGLQVFIVGCHGPGEASTRVADCNASAVLREIYSQSTE